MNKKYLLTFLLVFALASFVSAQESDYKFDSITVKFVDALTLEPFSNIQIGVYYDKYDNGDISDEKFYTTDSKGEIQVPVEGKVHYFRSDKGDNINYIKQGDSIIIDVLEKPEHTIYLSPIFDVEVKLKTDFNFLLSFFRMFRYGSYLEAPASELNMDSVIEPNCFMTTYHKGETTKQYSKKIKLQAYFSRDLNSPTKEPFKCSIYAWEGIRKVAGIEEIDFSSMKHGAVNKMELPLDMTYDDLMNQYPSIRPPESN